MHFQCIFNALIKNGEGYMIVYLLNKTFYTVHGYLLRSFFHFSIGFQTGPDWAVLVRNFGNGLGLRIYNPVLYRLDSIQYSIFIFFLKFLENVCHFRPNPSCFRALCKRRTSSLTRFAWRRIFSHSDWMQKFSFSRRREEIIEGEACK